MPEDQDRIMQLLLVPAVCSITGVVPGSELGEPQQGSATQCQRQSTQSCKVDMYIYIIVYFILYIYIIYLYIYITLYI